MTADLPGALRQLFRRLFPATVRRRLWDRYGRRYFERTSLRAISRHVDVNITDPTDSVRRLVRLLRENRYRVDHRRITRETGLEFKGFSNQDLIAYLYFNGRSTGFFLDIGAFDGLEISNTWALEQLGWDGICIEPVPEIFARLSANRGCHLVNAALARESGHAAPFLKVSGQLGLSGLARQMPARIRDGLDQQGLDVETIQVDTVTFDEVMQNHPAVMQIDFLSIDVEGGELDVLESIDFQRYRFGLITIENNAGRARLRDFLGRQGYVLFIDLGVDLMFVPAGS